MPAGYIHAIESLLSFGRSYFAEHQQKDAPASWLGRAHRAINHEWYQLFGIAWTFQNPIPQFIERAIETINQDYGPEEAELYEAIYLSHDYTDRLHDRESLVERKLTVAFHIFLMVHPEIIKTKFGVDVAEGRIHRVVDGVQVWESSPETARDYERLLRYIRVVVRNDPELQEILTTFEKQYDHLSIES